MNNKPILCTAHRGIWDDATPQNTVEAIAKAYASGAEWVETDFNEEPDGAILCYHDDGVRAKIKPPFKVPTLAAEFGAAAFTCNFYETAFVWAKQLNIALRPKIAR